MSKWRNPRCCAGALTIRDNKILLVQRSISPWLGYWDIPGGYCEAEEHPQACAIRETLEEAGIHIRINSFHGIWLDPNDDPNYGHNICIYYLAEPTRQEKACPDNKETDVVAWFAPLELPKKIAFPAHIPNVLQAWLNKGRQ